MVIKYNSGREESEGMRRWVRKRMENERIKSNKRKIERERKGKDREKIKWESQWMRLNPSLVDSCCFLVSSFILILILLHLYPSSLSLPSTSYRKSNLTHSILNGCEREESKKRNSEERKEKERRKNEEAHLIKSREDRVSRLMTISRSIGLLLLPSLSLLLSSFHPHFSFSRSTFQNWMNRK